MNSDGTGGRPAGHFHRGGARVTAVEPAPTKARGGASNGLSARRPFDRWYRYPAGFSPSSLDLALDVVSHERETGIVVDPFAGAASAGTAVIARGGTFVGLEAHPEIAELAALKFQRYGPPVGLIKAAAAVVDRSKHLPVDNEHDLVRRCFAQPVLAELVGLREVITSDQSVWAGYLKWALIGTLRDVASVKVGWPYQRPALARSAPHRDPTKRFLQRVQWMADDLVDAPAPNNSGVVAGDSRESLPWVRSLGGQTAHGCISSPPYLNNFDYADATRLELYFWGVARSWKQMCHSVRSGMLVATTQQTREGLARAAAERLECYPNLDRNLRPLIGRLETERVRRGRGKEYDRVLGPYFVGLASVLSNLFEALAPKARCAWIVGDSAPYGIYLDTPALIASLAGDLGFDVLADVELRARGQRWRTNGTRHCVGLTERLITFNRP